jgi:butyrate kinase
VSGRPGVGPTAGESRKFRILVVNPGSMGTRLALFRDDEAEAEEEVRHPARPPGSGLWGEVPARRASILEFLERRGVAATELDAVVGRGGLLRPVDGGVYEVNEAMLRDARAGVQGHHPANLGAPLARAIADVAGVQAFVVDPVSVDEFDPESHVSGLAGIRRRSLSHALSVHASVRALARELGRPWRELRVVVAHLGGGVSVCPVLGGRIVDANNAVSEGPFSPQRSGGLPVQELLDLVYSGHHTEAEVRRMTVGRGGFLSYLGTDDVPQVERRIDAGDDDAALVMRAFVHQVAKEIGGMATVLSGRLDAVVLTGSLARSERLTSALEERIGYLAPVRVLPVQEMQALARGALLVLRGEEPAQAY